MARKTIASQSTHFHTDCLFKGMISGHRLGKTKAGVLKVVFAVDVAGQVRARSASSFEIIANDQLPPVVDAWVVFSMKEKILDRRLAVLESLGYTAATLEALEPGRPDSHDFAGTVCYFQVKDEGKARYWNFITASELPQKLLAAAAVPELVEVGAKAPGKPLVAAPVLSVGPVVPSLPASDNLLAAGLAYARRGWSIIWLVNKLPVPGTRWKQNQTKCDSEAKLRKKFNKHRPNGVGVVLGKVSGGLSVRDFDIPEPYLAWSIAKPADAARIPTDKTARGYHVFGYMRKEAYAKFDDGELLGSCGRYVVLPPSVHPSGVYYKWVIEPPQDLARMPLLPLSLRKGPTAKKTTKGSIFPGTNSHTICVSMTVPEAIDASLPNGPGQRNGKIYELASRLKAVPGLDTSETSLRDIFVSWFEKALPVINSKDFEENWAEFERAWLTAPPFVVSLDAVYKAACLDPDARFGNKPLGVLASFCRILSEVKGNGTFFLSCWSVKELFGCTAMTACRRLKKLMCAKVIEEVVKGTPSGSPKDRKATVWRYTGASTQIDGGSTPGVDGKAA